MRGKRFSTPTGQPVMRSNGYSQLHVSPAATSPGWWANAARTAPTRPRPRSAASTGMRLASPTHERRSQALLASSTQRSVPGASVHHMLSDLVDLSHSIAALLEQGQLTASTPAPSAADRQQEATLKTQEIERIVRRVEAHFVDRIQSLESTNAALTGEVRRLRDMLQAAGANGHSRRVNGASDVRGGLREESEALDELDKAWAGEAGNGAADSEAERLRRVLLAEKRQRLRVEEQTQSLTEQHAKVVGTLERRLKKQEEQLYDLIAAIDRGYGGMSSPTSASPARSTERGASHRLATPRRLLRQQLAQHQQTQRALQQYKENLRFEPPSPLEGDESAAASAMDDLGLDDVHRTLESIRSSKPPTVLQQSSTREAAAPHAARVEPLVVHSPVITAQAPPPPRAAPTTAPRPAAPSTSEVDEITMFLDNITRELESLDAQ